MAYKDKEKQKEYNKKWREENPEYKKEWRKNNKDKEKEYRRRSWDKNKEKEYAYRKENSDKVKEWSKKYSQRLKYKVLSHYSKKEDIECGECGFFDVRALHIDHINNNGSEERKRLSNGLRTCGSTKFYRFLIKNNFPEGYQVLCANCNEIKEMKRRGYE